MLHGRCYVCLAALLLFSTRTGFATPSESDTAELDDTGVVSPNATLSPTEELDEEAEGPSNEPMTFEYFDEIAVDVCETREEVECRPGNIPECRTREIEVCSQVAETRRFECGAERKWSARRSGGRLGSPIMTDTLQSCCALCQGVPNSLCRSWWRRRGRNEPCYINSNR